MSMSAGRAATSNAFSRWRWNWSPSSPILLARSTSTTAALKREGKTIPIVFVNVTEPAERGFVQNLVRPGGNITGFTNFESMIGGKWLQLIKEVDPRITRVAVIFNPQMAPFAGLFVRSIEAAAPGLTVEVMAMPVASDAEIEAAMRDFARRPGGGPPVAIRCGGEGSDLGDRPGAFSPIGSLIPLVGQTPWRLRFSHFRRSTICVTS